MLIALWCFCQLLILRCLMHVKLNVIKLFNRLSLLANQNTSTSMQQSMSMVSSVVIQAPSSTFNNHTLNHDTLTDVDCANNLSADAVKSSHHQKFIMSSSFQLHEDDLSKIDVKSLVWLMFILLLQSHNFPPSSSLFPTINKALAFLN